jgi:hypothetical protein
MIIGIITLFTIILGIATIIVVTWSITQTRKKYYNDYVSRKRKDL